MDDNELKPTVSTYNLETILEENVQSEISLSHVIDVNTRVFEKKISSGSDRTYHGIPVVPDLNASPPECALPGLTSTNN